MSQFDCTDVIILLEAALAEARLLDGTEAITDFSVRDNRPAAAVQSRQVQVLMHYCERAQAESAAIFWTLKGFPDPLREDA